MDADAKASARAVEFLLEVADLIPAEEAWALRGMLAELESSSSNVEDRVERMLLIKGIRLNSPSKIAEIADMVRNGEFGPPSDDPTRTPTL